MIEITYYVLLNKVRIDFTKVVSGSCEIVFQVTRNISEVEEPEKLTDDKVQLSRKVIRITEASGKFAEIVFPHEGIVLENSDQFLLFQERVSFVADDQINMHVRANGASAQVSFVVPRPNKPHPSWLWFNGNWNAPVPMPPDSDSVNYKWDELNLNWSLS